jgi:hypothetical protein
MPTTLNQDQIESRLQLVDEHMRAENDHDVDRKINKKERCLCR